MLADKNIYYLIISYKMNCDLYHSSYITLKKLFFYEL